MGFWEYLENSRDANIGDIKKLQEGLVDSDELYEIKSYLEYEIKKLRAENGKLKLIIKAILIKSFEKGLFTQEEIEALCQEIDAEDGKIDGQYNGELLPKKAQN